MTDTDLILIYKKFDEIDRQLKELRKDVCCNIQAFPKSYSQMIADNKPVQWPGEPYTDYLKRIGEYNEASAFEDDTK